MSASNPDVFQVIGRSDSTALLNLMQVAPDPVIARLLNIAPGHLRGRIFGAVEKDRMEATIKPLMERESAADPEKDAIVTGALSNFLAELLRSGKIKREDDFYIGH